MKNAALLSAFLLLTGCYVEAPREGYAPLVEFPKSDKQIQLELKLRREAKVADEREETRERNVSQAAKLATREPVTFAGEVGRTWTSVDGAYTVAAVLLSYDPQENRCTIQKADGEKVVLTLDQLTLEDRNYIRGKARR